MRSLRALAAAWWNGTTDAGGATTLRGLSTLTIGATRVRGPTWLSPMLSVPAMNSSRRYSRSTISSNSRPGSMNSSGVQRADRIQEGAGYTLPDSAQPPRMRRKGEQRCERAGVGAEVQRGLQQNQ